MQGTQTQKGGGNAQSSGGRTLPGSPLASPPPGSSAPFTGKPLLQETDYGHGGLQQRANNAEERANKPSLESNLSCQRGERARCLSATVSNRQIRACARPVLPGEVNKTLSASIGHNNMQRGAQQQRHSRPYSPRSPCWRQPCPWKRTLAAPESRHDSPAAMSAHIPEVDSCYAADLTRCCLAPPFLSPRL